MGSSGIKTVEGSGQHGLQNDNDQVMHGCLPMMDPNSNNLQGTNNIHSGNMQSTLGTIGDSNHQRNFQKIKRRNQIQNANAHSSRSPSHQIPGDSGDGDHPGNNGPNDPSMINEIE